MPKRYNSITSYMAPAFDDELYDEAMRYFADHADVDTIDTFVGCGVSGIVMAQRLAIDFKKNLFVVRKQTENSHTGKIGEGVLGPTWVFVDDLIDSGKTLYRAQLSIGILAERKDFKTQQQGSFLYGHWNGMKWIPEDWASEEIETWVIPEVREELKEELKYNDKLREDQRYLDKFYRSEEHR